MQAKRDYTNWILSQAKPGDIWKIAGWASGKRKARMPPLKNADGNVATGTKAQAGLLANMFFPKESPHVDPDQPLDPEAKPTRQHMGLDMK